MTRLRDLERRAAAERAEAKRWAHEHRYSDELAEPRFFSGPSRRVSIDSTTFENTDDGADSGDTWAMWEQMMLRSGRDYNPLIGGTSVGTMQARELRDRMEHVLDQLPEDQRDLLNARFVELLTFEELAERFPAKRGRKPHASYQAMQQRLRVALDNLRRAFGEHFLDALEEE